MKLKFSTIFALLTLAALIATLPQRASGESEWYGSQAGSLTATNSATNTVNGPVIDASKYTSLGLGVFTSGAFTGTPADETNKVILGFAKSVSDDQYAAASVYVVVTNGVNSVATSVDTSACQKLKLVSVGNSTKSNAVVTIYWGGRVTK